MDVSVGVPVHPAKEKPPINVVGDVGGRIAIMVVSSHVCAMIISVTCLQFIVHTQDTVDIVHAVVLFQNHLFNKIPLHTFNKISVLSYHYLPTLNKS
jgi:hypothetical protein